jgi:hypothetical protein
MTENGFLRPWCGKATFAGMTIRHHSKWWYRQWLEQRPEPYLKNSRLELESDDVGGVKVNPPAADKKKGGSLQALGL